MYPKLLLMKKNFYSVLSVLSFTLLISTTFISQTLKAQTMPYPALVGYWENWNSLSLTSVDSRYNVIIVAFPLPSGGTDYNITQLSYGPHNSSSFKAAITTLQGQGKKVLLSIGGSTAPATLDNDTEKNTFVSSVGTMLTTYGFDGLDIDLEGSSTDFTNIKMTGNTDVKITNLISAVQSILANYQTAKSKRCLLTMAPEVMYSQGGYATAYYKSGAYLPIIEALRNDIDLLQVQLYNVGQGIKALDGKTYSEGSADFIIAMTEMMIKGFTAAELSGGSGSYSGLSESKIAVGLPGCNSTASGYVSAAVQKQAIDYLRGVGSKPGTYSLIKVGGYPNLGGMMTWSINEDLACNPSKGIASSFATIFNGVGVSVAHNEVSNEINLYPNPAQQQITLDMGSNTLKGTVSVYNSLGQMMLQKQINNEQKISINLADFPAGVYFIQSGAITQKFMKVD
jgi:chitinase